MLQADPNLKLPPSAEELAEQAEQEKEKLAAKLRELGMDPDTL